MNIETFDIPGPTLLRPKRFTDKRGSFCEVFNQKAFSAAIGFDVNFVQDNQSISLAKGTVRGLHAQKPPYAQGKLVRCTRGSIRDFAVDIRKGSKTYGQHIEAELSEENGAQLWVPEGFLHGFETLTDECHVHYKQTAYYEPGAEIGIMWSDLTLAIGWTACVKTATVSDKDAGSVSFANFKSPF